MATRVMPSRGAPQATISSKPSVPPNQTNYSLYCTNLPDKLQKQDLRLSLYTLFSTYGPVLDVVALKTMKCRGTAHIVYRDVQTSTQAMRSLQGFDFFGKEMRIQYAKTKSETISKLDGTYKLPTVAATAGGVASTELQQSIFNAPPSSLPPAPGAPPQTTGLKPPAAAGGADQAADGSKSPQGVKRRRDDESDDEDAPMDEDDEGDAPMEDSSDED
ncbi:MAG: U2 snRNP complex subunit msl1 [Caeruleum heppii]|nr:MAG: U2 snRNP complex subunit msl1 [Caeruleum heppii]